MGCAKPSRVQIQTNGDLFNESSNVKKKLVAGLHVHKTREEGIEGGLQMGYITTRVKNFTKVEGVTPIPLENRAILDTGKNQTAIINDGE